jgi:PAS domain S-box-containing protein
MFDASETIQVFNARAAELLDIPAEYLATHPTFSELVQRQIEKDDFAKNDEVLRNWITQSVAAAARQTYERERPDGTVLEIRTVPLESGGGVRTYTDITAQKAAEHALRDSEARFRTLTEAMPAMVFVSNSEGRNEYVSPQYQAYTGLTAEELREAGWNKVVHPDDLSGATSPWTTARERGQPYSIECRVRRADGEYRWFTARAAPLKTASGQVERWMGTCIDIHDLKLAEEALAQGEERLRLATEATGLGTYDTDLRTGWREWSPQTRAILGLGPDAPVGRRVMVSLLHPDDRERVIAAHDQAIATPGQPLQIDFRIVRADTGEVRWVSSLSRVLCDAEGHPIRLVGTILDRTAAKQAHLALEESEARYRLLAQNTGDAIFLNGPDKVRRYVSPAVRDLLGYEPEALVGSCPEPMIHPDDLERVMPEFENVLAGHRHSSRTSTYRMRHAEGHWVPVEARRSVLRGETGEPEGVISVVRDISDRVALEERLRQSQKMEALGALTGGIAHDFNNLLTVIIGNAELVADGAAGPDIAPALARQILEAAEKGADLTQKLLAFARRQSLRPERLQVEQVITEMMPLLQRAIGEHIELSTRARRGSLAALTDRTLLESAILNLALNARDAMPQGGVLTISMEERLAGPGAGSLPVGQPVVSITVSDTGTGMPPEVLARAVEPFFTTKEVGKGSGLGLSMVYGFAEQSGGHVRIESEVSRGTAVTILLPAVALEAASVGVEADARPAVKGSGRVLLVEDDPSVLTFVAGQLTSLGYDVEAVPTGVDALERLHRDSQFDLVFTDVMLPKGISGVELARKARGLNPKMKILLTSGYPEEVFHAQGRPDEGTLLLRKPYRRKELAETLRKVLDH